MLTPQEVSERAFAKASFGGYNMGMVDEFLDTLTEDYSALYKENAGLKAKMKVLADKVEEYRSTEGAMRKALLTAQTMADEMVKDAERKQAQMLTDAENEAKEQMADIHREIAQEENRLVAARNATAAYVGKLRALHKQELEYLNALENVVAPIPQARPRQESQVEAAVAEIEASMNRMMEEDALPAQTEPAAPAEPDPEEDTRSFPRPSAPAQEDVPGRIDLNDLQFGKDIDL